MYELEGYSIKEYQNLTDRSNQFLVGKSIAQCKKIPTNDRTSYQVSVPMADLSKDLNPAKLEIPE